MPEAHAGRLLDHVHLRVRDLEASKRVRDLEASKRFYAAHSPRSDLQFGRATAGSPPTRSTSATTARRPALHIAFQAADPETVGRFHEAAIAAGGRDNGAPGEREYHPGYYAAYVLDPDGTNVEAVYHGPVRRSAPSVVFAWDD